MGKYKIIWGCVYFLSMMLFGYIFLPWAIDKSTNQWPSLNRPSVLMNIVLIIGFTVFYYLILYFEKINEQRNLDLLYNRYMEYLKIFVWLAGFGLISYATIFANVAIKRSGLGNMGGLCYSPVAALLHVVLILIFGISLVIYAFHVKLKQIEVSKKFNKKSNKKK